MAEANREQAKKAAAQAIAAMIRQSSEAGRLTSPTEAFGRVADPHLRPWPTADPAAEVRALLQEIVDGNEDVHELAARDGSRRYYSSLFMTQPYALILLRKEDDPRQLIAESIRQNSSLYPRPLPLDIFTQPPFDLTLEEIRECLERMTAEEEYGDIARTTTSASRIFLYSSRHLEPEHASMLAEWLDVGQFENP